MNAQQHIITETNNGITNYISLNNEGQIVSVTKNPMELPGFMTKEQAFKVVAALRLANKDTKYRVKAASQALRDYVTDLIVNQLPEAPMVADEVIDKAVESWKPKVETKKEAEKQSEAETAEQPAEEAAPETAEPVAEEPAEPEAEPVAEVAEAPVEAPKPEKKKKGKKLNK